MYIPKDFQVKEQTLLLTFMQAHNFATIVNIIDGKPFAAHIPFAVSTHNDRIVLASHVSRANPLWKAFDGTSEVLVIFQGPHAYISPSLYDARQSVPTWNYAAVHAYGVPRIVENPDEILAAMITTFEGEYQAQWNELPERYKQGMKAGIVGFEIEATRLEGKLKLSQNKTIDEQARIADHLLQSDRTEIRETGVLMHSVQNIQRVQQHSPKPS